MPGFFFFFGFGRFGRFAAFEPDVDARKASGVGVSVFPRVGLSVVVVEVDPVGVVAGPLLLVAVAGGAALPGYGSGVGAPPAAKAAEPSPDAKHVTSREHPRSAHPRSIQRSGRDANCASASVTRATSQRVERFRSVRTVGVAVGVSLLAALAVALSGCGASEQRVAAGQMPQRLTYYGGVQPIFASRCAGCHYDGGIAPFSLTRYRSAYAHRAAIAKAVRDRIMPPWLAENGHRRYRDDLSLSDREIDAIVGWVRSGAPRGSRGKVAPARRLDGGVSRIDLRLALPVAYTPKAATDDYHCFAFRWPLRSPTYVSGLAARPGQTSEVHHVAVYLVPPRYARVVDAWDDAEPGPGYTCFGGPSGREARLIPIQLLGGWTPGSLGGDFPAGTGINVVPGSRLVLQVHYNLEGARPRPDRTALELRLDRHVRRAASWVFWLDARWAIDTMLRRHGKGAGGYAFEIPAGKRGVRVSVAGDPIPLFAAISGGLDLSDGFWIYGALLHMHRLGVSARLVLEGERGRKETLLSIPRWDFDHQRVYFFERPLLFLPGERLVLECRYDNTASAQPIVNGVRRQPRDVTWGERSSDEMCVGSLYIGERR